MLIGEGRRFGWVLLAGVLNGVENKPVGTILAETRQRLVYLMSNAFADSTGETTDDTEEHRGTQRTSFDRQTLGTDQCACNPLSAATQPAIAR
jgi:hypothetical protein